MDVLEFWTWSHEFGSWKIARCGNFVHLCNVAPRGLKELCSFNKVSVGQMVKMVAEMVSCCSETLAQLLQYIQVIKNHNLDELQPTDSQLTGSNINSRLPFDKHH